MSTYLTKAELADLQTKQDLNTVRPLASEKILVTASEAARLLSIGRSTFFRKVAEGHLPKPVHFGGITRWRMDDLRLVGQKPTDSRAGVEHDQ